MTCNITSPPYIEPLPLYQRDPETASIISSAPSYHSEAPSYHSRRQSTAQHPGPRPSLLAPGPSTGRNHGRADTPSGLLPSPRYAPGYENRAHGSVGDIELQNYNSSHWSNIHSSHASRQYHAVASRRANAANAASSSMQPWMSGLMPTLNQSSTSIPTLPSLGSSLTNSTTSAAANGAAYTPESAHEGDAADSQQPLSPQEDPALVGESAAARARSQRLYREMCMRNDPAVLRMEAQSWDFMLWQMADAERREESWRQFRADLEARTRSAGKVRFGLGIGGGRKLLARGGLRGRR